MGQVNKHAKEQILKMMLQEVPTEEIAKQLHFAVGTVRNVFEELRQEYGVNSKVGIAKAYLFEQIQELSDKTQAIAELCSTTCKITCNSKTFSSKAKGQNLRKKQKK